MMYEYHLKILIVGSLSPPLLQVKELIPILQYFTLFLSSAPRYRPQPVLRFKSIIYSLAFYFISPL